MSPADDSGLFQRAKGLHQSGDLESALPLYEQVLQGGPYRPHAAYLFGVLLSQLGRYTEAIPVLEEAARRAPEHEPTACALAHAFFWVNRGKEAEGWYLRVLRRNGRNAEAAVGLARLYNDAARWDDLVFIGYQAHRFHPGNLELTGWLVRALARKDRHAEAAELLVRNMLDTEESDAAYDWLEDLFPRVTVPSRQLLADLERLESTRGQRLHITACVRVKDTVAAEIAFTRMREVAGDTAAMTFGEFADLLQQEKLFSEAETYHWKELERDPSDLQRTLRLANALLGRAREDIPEKYVEAKELGEFLLNQNSEDPGVLDLMGGIYMGASRPELALRFYDRLLELNPDHPIFGSPYLFNSNYDENRTAGQIFEAHRRWGEISGQGRKPGVRAWKDLDRNPEKQLRIGFVSPDLGNHPVGYFFINVLNAFERDRLDVFLYSNRDEGKDHDKLSREFFDTVGERRWRWTRNWPDRQLVRQIEEDGIDILVDMAGHTAYHRLPVFMQRPAPLQVTWLGYPNTTGLCSIDYRFSDAVTEPPGASDERSTETIYRLPNGFHSFRIPEKIPEVVDPPMLKNGTITFGSYNNMNKLGSRTIALWADLLKAVPRSRLVIKHKTLAVLDNRESLRSQFAMYGIQARRVELLETTPGQKQHLETYGDLDIALDPLAYNGTTTSCDSLLMGVPVLTLPGEAHAARVTASLLHRVGLDEWIASDWNDFIRRGKAAARDPERLTAIRRQLRQRFLESPLGNATFLAGDMEDAFRDMWRRWCQKRESSKKSSFEELPWKL